MRPIMRLQEFGRRFMLLVAALAGLVIAAPSRAQDVDSVVKKLKATNTLTIGYRETSIPMSYLDADRSPTGYSVELCKKIAEAAKTELGLPEIKFAYVPVTIQTRQALVANGTVDIECGGSVNTFTRQKQVDFTFITYIASSQLLVLKSSGIQKLEDLNGKVVAIATAGTSEKAIKEFATKLKLDMRILPIDDHPAALIAVESRRADAYFSDNSAFFGLLKQSRRPENLAIVGGDLTYEPQGFLVPKNNPTFLWIANHTLAGLFKSGEGKAIFDKWFGPFGVTMGDRLKAAWDIQSLPE